MLKIKRKFYVGVSIAVILGMPYALTRFWHPKEMEQSTLSTMRAEDLVFLTEEQRMDEETYLVGVVAKQIPVSYGTEAIKAQCIIARTNFYYEQEQKKQKRKEDSYLTMEEMKKIWGTTSFYQYYRMYKECLEQTAGEVLEYKNHTVVVPFHRLSAGRTRSATEEDYAYICGVDSKTDITCSNYLTIQTISPAEVVKKVKKYDETIKEEDLLNNIKVAAMDDDGYVLTVQIGKKVMKADVFQTLFLLPSPHFSIHTFEKELRIIVKGCGSGYGMSQYGAKKMAQDGKNAKEILAYYYPKLQIVTHS